MNRILLTTGGVAAVIGMTFIAGPSLLGLGPASACACARLPAKNTEAWRICAATKFALSNKIDLRPISNFSPSQADDGSEYAIWKNRDGGQNFQTFLSKKVNPHCGSFEAAKENDEQLQAKRDWFGYDDYFIPKNAVEALLTTKEPD